MEKIGNLTCEDTVCDLLYQFKYMFVGYSLKAEAEQAIEKFPISMREKLKFLLTHSSTAETAQQQQNLATVVQHQQQQQNPHFSQTHHQNPYLLQQMAANSILNISNNSIASNSMVEIPHNPNILLNESFGGIVNNSLLNSSSGGSIMEVDEKHEHLMTAGSSSMGTQINPININQVNFLFKYYLAKINFFLDDKSFWTIFNLRFRGFFNGTYGCGFFSSVSSSTTSTLFTTSFNGWYSNNFGLCQHDA